MRTLIIDNYDSFTFNLFQMIAAINGEEPIVVHNDQVEWRTLRDEAFDNIVISPGPGRPERDADIGLCKAAILAAEVPILGVCLGHQAIAHLYGGRVRHAPEPMHGRVSRVFHDGSELWEGIPQGLGVVRYHSLVVDDALPACLRRTAWTSDGLVMALRHASLPIWGVQFHPESIATEHGDRLLARFRDLSRSQARATVPDRVTSIVPRASAREAAASALAVRARAIAPPDPERAFETLFRGRGASFWLDSSRAEPQKARFSFMGCADGPRSATVAYDAAAREVRETCGGVERRTHESIYAYLDRELARRACDAPDLPFDFHGGFVGYFGYELKVEAGATHHRRSAYPDAAFVFADRVLAIDAEANAAYLVCVVAPGEESAADAWFDDVERRLREGRPHVAATDDAPIAFRLRRSHARYLDDVARCKALIRDGETYEVCLTNAIHTSATPDPLATYLTLRRTNPAPYSAFLDFDDVTVMSSSPERFLRIDRDRNVESKPIKGTRPRGSTPDDDERLRRDLATSEKDRSENLMIVDLLRNDLGVVCEIGSVHVPKLMDVETYETVHQLVSTVRGRLKRGLCAVDCVRHAFPGGSITGAPKLRTMNILDELEDAARGVYTGAIGFLGLNGTADLSVVIRTIVQANGETTIGVGGAIVTLSDAEAEFEETMVKARALVRAIVATARGNVDDRAYETAIAELRANAEAAL